MRLLGSSLLLSKLALVNGIPHPIVAGIMEGAALQKRDDMNKNYIGEPPTERTIYVVISLFFMMILSLLLGRFRVSGPARILTNNSCRSTIRSTTTKCNDVAQHYIDDRTSPVLPRILFHIFFSHHAGRSRPVQSQSLLLCDLDLSDIVHCVQGYHVSQQGPVCDKVADML